MRERLSDQVALILTGAVFVVLGTLCSQATWLAAVAMAVVAFFVLFAGVVSSALASAAFSLLLAFILPVSLKAPVSLQAMKANPALSALEMIRQGRLSVSPVRDAEWAAILKMAGE